MTNSTRRVLRIRQVCARVGLSVATIYKLIGEGKFPKQVKLGERASGWLEADIDAWIERLANMQPSESNSAPAGDARFEKLLKKPVDERMMPALAKRRMSSVALPVPYVEACKQVSLCETVEAAKKFADQMDGIAHYAKLANDSRLLDYALRLRVRSQVRFGELVNAIPVPKGGSPKQDPNSLKSIAQRTGMSEGKISMTKRAARVPADIRDRRIEQDPIPAIETLAKMAPPSMPEKRRRAGELSHNYKEIFGNNTDLQRFLSFTRRYSPDEWAQKMSAEDAGHARRFLTEIFEWADRFAQRLPARPK